MENDENNIDNNGNNDENKKKNDEIDLSIINPGFSILINLYIYNTDLHKYIKESITSNDKSTQNKGECFLIREDYFSDFINFFLYKDVYQLIKNDKKDPKKSKAAIFDRLNKNYKTKLHDKINNSKEIPSLIDEKLYKIEYCLNHSKTEMIFIYKYSLLNKDILNTIFKDKHKNENIKLFNKVNNKKLIIKYEQKKSIFIGTLTEDDINNIFIPEIILVYDDIAQLQNQFNYFDKNDYTKFEQTLALKEKITDLKNGEKIVGKAYLIDKNKYNNLSKYNENILSSLYNNYEAINKKIKEPFEKELKKDKYFIINYNYIKKLKDLFKFNDLLKKVSQNNSINDLIKEENIKLDRILIKDELSKGELFKISKKELKIDNNKIQYCQEFDIISNELKQYLEEYDLIQSNQEIIEIECLFGNNKIIMYSFSPNKKIAFVLSKNEKEEYIIELIFEFKDEEKLQNYLKLITEKGFDKVIELLNKKENENKYEILDDKKDLYGYAYEIIPLKKKELKIKEEIINMIKIYLYNKDILNKIEISKNNDNTNENVKINIFNEQCYLINKDIFKKYKEYYLYNDIQTYLDKNNNIINKKENINSDEIIFTIYEKIKKEEFFKNYINKDKLPLDKIDIKKTEIILEKEKKIFYNDDFIIINKEIYEKLLLKENIIITEYIINSGKIFLFFNSDENNQVLIGEIKNNNNYFNANAIIIFNNNTEFNTFKKDISEKDFSKIIISYYKKGQKLLSKDKKEIGVFVNINKENDIFKKVQEIKDDLNVIIKEIYNNYEAINTKIKEPLSKEINNQKYFIINNNYFNKLKDLLKFNDIFDKIKSNISINDLIEKEKSNFDIDLIKNELSKEELYKISKKDLKIDDNKIFQYYQEFEIISKELKKYLEEYDLIQSNHEIIEIECLFGDNKIIMHSIDQNKSIAIILSTNEKDEYITELIFEFNDEEKFHNYLKLITKKGFDKLIELLNKKENENKYEILDDKKDLYGYAYEIIPLKKKELKIKEEIINMIKIYLYNKDILNKIEISKNNDNTNENVKINIFNEQCYLINKDIFKKYKEYYLYNDIQTYLDKNNNIINKKENINSDEIIFTIYEKIKKEEFFKNYINKDKLPLDKIDIKKTEIILEKEKKIFYNDDFIIINKEIYEKLLLKENIIITEYIINSGKIFLFFNSDENNQVLIGEIKNNDNYFNANAIIIFNDIEKLNEFKKYLCQTSFSILILSFLKKGNQLYSVENKIFGFYINLNKENDIFSEVKEIKDDMNILISEIYINLEKIKKQIKESKFNEKEKYYIINNTWFKYLKENYDYDIIINELNKNEKFKQYLEVLLNSDKNEFKKEIIKDILKDKNNNDKNINKEIKKDEIKNLEIENNFQKLKIENNEKLYLDKFIIINDRIKELFEIIFKIKANEKLFLRLKCIIKNMNKTFNKNFIYVFYSLKNMFFANIGNLDEKEFLYETVSFLEINNQEYFEELYKKKELINNEIEKKFESLLTDNKDNKIFLTIEDDNKNAKAIIYLIKKIEIKNQINNNSTNNSLPKLDKNINKNPSLMKDFFFQSSKTFIYEKKIIIPENLEKDIKILIKYLLFKKELIRKYNYPKLFKNCYLINVIIWSKYKFFPFYKNLIDIVEEETKNLTPINNKPINSNESLINKIYESLVKLFKSNKELYESKNIDSVQSYLDKQINFEITMDYKNLNEKSIYYPTNFEIVDQYILDDMIKRNVIQNNHYLKSDIIVNNEKVLINCEQYQKGNQNNIILLVGNLTADSDFILKN